MRINCLTTLPNGALFIWISSFNHFINEYLNYLSMISNKLDCIMIKSVVPPVLLFKEMASSSDKSGDSLRFLSSPFCTYSNAQHKRGHFVFWCSAQKSTNTENPTTNPKKFNVWVHLGLGFVLIGIDPARKGKLVKMSH